MKTIEEICLEVLIKSGGDTSAKSEFVRLTTKEFKLSPKKINMLRVRGFAETGQLPALKEFILTTNKKTEALPWDTVLDYLESRDRSVVVYSVI